MPGALCGLVEACPHRGVLQRGVGAVSGNNLWQITGPLTPGRRDAELTAAEPWLKEQLCPRTESVPVLWQGSVSALPSPELA